MLNRVLIVLFLLATTLLGADITGTWAMSTETSAGTYTSTFTFKQDGENLTGTYSGQLGEAKVTGRAQGDAVEFSFEAAPGGETIVAKYKGRLESNGALKGTVDIGGLASGTFEAKRK